MNNHLRIVLALAGGLSTLLSTPSEAAITVSGHFNPNQATWESGTVDRNGTIGGNGDGSLSLDGGSTVTIGRSAYFGSGTSASTGTVTLSGIGTELTVTLDMNLGNNTGIGNLSILDGAVLNANQNGFLGTNGAEASGTVLIDGPGSLWMGGDGVIVGKTGDGSLTVQNQGTVEAVDLIVAQDAGSSGSLVVTGNGGTDYSNVILSGSLQVNEGGSARVSNGGRIDSGELFSVGGSFLLEGSTSSLTSSVETIISSEDGLANLTIQDGARVDTNRAFLGNGADTSGTITVKGDGSTLSSTGDITLGFLEGSGTLNISGGATISSDNYVNINNGSTLNIRDEGSEIANSIRVAVRDGGVLNVYAGATIISELGVLVNEGGTLNVFVDGDGMFQNVAGDTSAPQGLFGTGAEPGGTANFVATAGLAAGTYHPFTPDPNLPPFGNGFDDGTINAVGGTFDTSTGAFTVSEIVAPPESGPLGGLRVQYDEGMVVSFADGVGEIDFSVMQINQEMINGEFVLGAYAFDTTLEDTPTGLTFILQNEYEWSDVTFWYRADGETEWTQIDSEEGQVDSRYASLLVTNFSSYAVTSLIAPVPEPSSGMLLAGSAAAIAFYRRRLGRKALRNRL